MEYILNKILDSKNLSKVSKHENNKRKNKGPRSNTKRNSDK